VKVLQGGTLVYEVTTAGTTAVTPPLQEQLTYTVEIRSLTSLFESAPLTDTEYIGGQASPPANVLNFGGSNKDGVVTLTWSAVADAREYEIRYYSTGGTWAGGTTLTTLSSLNAVIYDVPVGTWRFGIKAKTSYGTESSVADTVDITVTSPSTPTGITTFYQSTPAPTSLAEGDIWYHTGDENHPYRAATAGADQIIAGEWVSIRDDYIDTAAGNAQTNAQSYADGVAATAQTNAESYADSIVDGKITTFYQTTPAPTGQLGDLWVHTGQNNRLYRAFSDNSNQIIAGEWQEIQDADIQQAISDAADAQDTADGKITTYFQSSAPSAPSAGDFWVDDSTTPQIWYRRNDLNTVWERIDGAIVSAQSSADGKSTVYRANGPTGPAGADEDDLWIDTADGNKLYQYVSGAWVAAQDENKNQTIRSGTEPPEADHITGDVWINTSDKNKVFVFDSSQSVGNKWVESPDLSKSTVTRDTTAPTSPITGDVWIDSSANNLIKIWNGASWDESPDNNKTTTFTQDGIPTPTAIGDIWIDTTGGANLLKVATSLAPVTWTAYQDNDIVTATELAGTKSTVFRSAGPTQPTGADEGDVWIETGQGNRMWQYNGAAWELAQDENKTTTFSQPAPAPTSTAIGDIWYDTGNGNKMYRAASIGADQIIAGEWELVQDGEIETALTTAQAKAEVFYQIDEPPETDRSTGDVWVDTNDGNRMYVFDETQGIGNKWVDASDNNKNRVFRQTTAPSGVGEVTGDLWYDTDDDDRTYRYDGATWVDVDSALTTAKQAKVFIETTVQTANFTAQAQYRYPCNTSGGSFTLTLPANPNAGDVVYFFDTDGTFDINNLTIGRNNEDIIALAEDMIVDVRYYSGGFQYVNATQGWVLI